MMPQPLQIIARFEPDVVHEFVVKRRIRGAGELEIEPDANAHFVAGVELRAAQAVLPGFERELAALDFAPFARNVVAVDPSPEMLGEAQLTRANGLVELSTFAAIVLGTSVGSFLFAR